MFLEECKYVIKEKKFQKFIIDVEIYCDSDEEILLKKIQMEKNSNHEENSDEEILEKIMMEKNLIKKILLKKITFFLHV